MVAFGPLRNKRSIHSDQIAKWAYLSNRLQVKFRSIQATPRNFSTYSRNRPPRMELFKLWQHMNARWSPALTLTGIDPGVLTGIDPPTRWESASLIGPVWRAPSS